MCNVGNGMAEESTPFDEAACTLLSRHQAHDPEEILRVRPLGEPGVPTLKPIHSRVNVVKGMCEGGQHIPSFGLPWDTHKSAWWCANFPVKPDITVNVVIKDCEHGKSNACFTMPAKGSGSARGCAN
eukprot:jgi/Tetstr1/427886/TSEL_017962.t1